MGIKVCPFGVVFRLAFCTAKLNPKVKRQVGVEKEVDKDCGHTVGSNKLQQCGLTRLTDQPLRPRGSTLEETGESATAVSVYTFTALHVGL